eukprot:TRINITY_DN21728_c0_g1_i1.p1 TRINITY_DN21728_c0_g1~~TRINITY_DN21728_c0_g1_i1.p1  ORF type:complete len:141 (-),score=5.12 TRINITY_DN21728_c0_g1_i1:148-570(-)
MEPHDHHASRCVQLGEVFYSKITTRCFLALPIYMHMGNPLLSAWCLWGQPRSKMCAHSIQQSSSFGWVTNPGMHDYRGGGGEVGCCGPLGWIKMWAPLCVPAGERCHSIEAGHINIYRYIYVVHKFNGFILKKTFDPRSN